MQPHLLINLFLEGMAHLLLLSSAFMILLRLKTSGTLLMFLGTMGMATGFGLRSYAEHLERIGRRSIPFLDIRAGTFDFLGLALEGCCIVAFAIGLFHFSTLFRNAVAGERRFRRRM